MKIKQRILKKVLTAVLFLSMTCCLSSAMAEEPAPTAETEPPVEAQTSADEKAQTASDSSESGAVSEVMTEMDISVDGTDLVFTAGDVTVESKVVLDYMNRALSVLESEEFEDLVTYAQEHEEVQDLLNEIVVETITFMREDRETTRKIFKTLGIDDIYLDLFDRSIDALEVADDFLDAHAQDEAVVKMKENLNRYMTDEEVKEVLKEVFYVVTSMEEATDPSA